MVHAGVRRLFNYRIKNGWSKTSLPLYARISTKGTALHFTVFLVLALVYYINIFNNK